MAEAAGDDSAAYASRPQKEQGGPVGAGGVDDPDGAPRRPTRRIARDARGARIPSTLAVRTISPLPSKAGAVAPATTSSEARYGNQRPSAVSFLFTTMMNRAGGGERVGM